MTDLRTVAQQALEFVTSEVWGTTPYMDVRVYEEAAKLRAALKAALAEPTTEYSSAVEPVQEPVAWLSRDDARLALWEAINKREFGNPTDDKLILDHLHQQGLWIGKYTAPPPPQRKPLTEEEMQTIYREFMLYQDGLTPSGLQRVARAIERAHGIKE